MPRVFGLTETAWCLGKPHTPWVLLFEEMYIIPSKSLFSELDGRKFRYCKFSLKLWWEKRSFSP